MSGFSLHETDENNTLGHVSQPEARRECLKFAAFIELSSRLYFDDHKTPHFHAEYGGLENLRDRRRGGTPRPQLPTTPLFRIKKVGIVKSG